MLSEYCVANYEWGMGNGERGMGNGERGMGNGKRGMGNGEWETGNGEWGETGARCSHYVLFSSWNFPCPRSLPLLPNPNRFQVDEFVNAGNAQFPSVTGFFDTAEGQSRIGFD